MSLSNSYMYKLISIVHDQWIHLVLNYISPSERFQVFKDGALVPGQPTKIGYGRAPGDGRLVLGRRYPNSDYYSSLDLDEVVFFNRKLTASEVINIYNKDNWFFHRFKSITIKQR